MPLFALKKHWKGKHFHVKMICVLLGKDTWSFNRYLFADGPFLCLWRLSNLIQMSEADGTVLRMEEDDINLAADSDPTELTLGVSQRTCLGQGELQSIPILNSSGISLSPITVLMVWLSQVLCKWKSQAFSPQIDSLVSPSCWRQFDLSDQLLRNKSETD